MIVVGDVLDTNALAWVRAQLEGIEWQPGATTAGRTAQRVKRNEQAVLSNPTGEALEAFLRGRIERHPAFQAAARVRQLSPLIVSRTADGGGYGNHIDNAHMAASGRRMRSDLSFTLFLSDPADYEGGELVVEDPFADRTVKLPAGDLVLYPSGSIHRVEPVTRGTRLACVGWIESTVRDEGGRQILWDLEQARAQWPDGADDLGRLMLDKSIAALLRRWADS